MPLKKTIGWTITVFTAAIYSFIFATYLTFRYGIEFKWVEENGIMSIGISFFLIFLLINFLVIFAVREIKKRNVDLKGRVRIAFIAIFLILLVPIIKDTTPVENDYTWDDLKAPSENAKESFKILRIFALNATPDIEIELPDGLDIEDYSNVNVYQDQIIDAWHQIQIWRDYIDQLNSFDGIADFTEPDAEFLAQVRQKK